MPTGAGFSSHEFDYREPGGPRLAQQQTMLSGPLLSQKLKATSKGAASNQIFICFYINKMHVLRARTSCPRQAVTPWLIDACTFHRCKWIPRRTETSGLNPRRVPTFCGVSSFPTTYGRRRSITRVPRCRDPAYRPAHLARIQVHTGLAAPSSTVHWCRRNVPGATPYRR